MAANDKFEGWLGLDKESVKGNMQWGEFEPKKWSEDDVDIEVSHCGICGSDLHMLSSGWSQTPYPCVVGHEIVGKAVRVGSNVKDITVGDRVGVGAQARSCLKPDCEECSTHQENYCGNGNISTYGGVYPGDEGKSYGGYAKHNRTHNRFVFKIPEGLDSADAAPMLCGGITVFSPLKRHGAGPGKKVGIVGVGGLGHFAVLFARALGADKVVAISRKASKRDEAIKLGADEYIATDDDKDWETKHARSLDLVICTVNNGKMPIGGYLKLLRPRGTFVQVGAPDDDLPTLNAFDFIFNGISLRGSLIGSPKEIQEMLDFVAEKKIKPWINEYPMKEANKAVVDFVAGKPRYRISLIN